MNKKHRFSFVFILLVCAILLIAAKKFTPSYHTKTIMGSLDTVSEITVLSRTSSPIKKAEKYLDLMDSELSSYNEDSTLYRYNSGSAVTFSKDAKELIDKADELSKKHPEYFSVYLEPLIKGWDIKNNTGTIPEVDALLKKSNEQKAIELGGIAKGYVTDKLAEMLKKDGVTSAMINLGGNTYAIGKKNTQENWKVGIANPKNPEEIIGIISCEDMAVITSGDYQRYFEKDGKIYHHILDPKTGYPANSGLRSVSIISKSATIADFLSTAIFVAGIEEGKKLLSEYDAMGIFITDDTVYFSKSLENIFKQTDFSYKYKFIY